MLLGGWGLKSNRCFPFYLHLGMIQFPVILLIYIINIIAIEAGKKAPAIYNIVFTLNVRKS